MRKRKPAGSVAVNLARNVCCRWSRFEESGHGGKPPKLVGNSGMTSRSRGLPNGLELSRSAAQACSFILGQLGRQAPSRFRPPAESASASC